MMRSFRKRLIRNGRDLFKSHPSFFKVALFSIIIATAFWFRTWAERGAGSLPPDGELSSVPVLTAPIFSSDPSPSPLSSGDPTPSVEKVDLNSAAVAIIETLPAVGPKLAQEIVRYREERGPFRKVEDLLEVKGIGPKKLSRLAPYLIFGSNDEQ
ncbi:MAG: helix-hairpin-helix domain-containing protein [Candidatus Manganitrophus sp.]|nr:MAG: helix-hairpin-helix domain-containing protein [Candidatus Manganitrophus sp.]